MDPTAALASARSAAGLSQRALARRTGIAQPTIARIETGDATPLVDTLERLLRACGAELDVLLPSAEPAVPPEQWTTVQGILAQTPTERVEQMLAWGRLVTELRAAGARLRG